ncbi:MAG TPA: hydantoinase B/oxoprolinase family protein [Steroidobacteraceae bacterium]|nr:hydantoinase B/oxoprolinase family protein [Steroidobacteraceae bacterium]
MSPNAQYDPITIEIIQSSLAAITEEMCVTTRRTAMSSVIYEVLDFGVAVTDRDGNLASSGSGIPAFVGMLDHGVKTIIEKFARRDTIEPGDVYLTNVPHRGGVSHLNDVVVIAPIFHEGVLLAWAANKAHWLDVGGMSPGSMDPAAADLYQEGLQLPEIKLFDAGVLNQAVFDIVIANCRQKETTTGDLWACVASVKTGERRVIELAQRYGNDTLMYAIERYIDYGEAVSRRGMKALPRGTFTAEDQLNDGTILRAKITITDTKFTVDFTDFPPQRADSFNFTQAITVVNSMMAFKSITSPRTPANAGTFKPLEVVCKPGSLCSATYPAATGLYFVYSILIHELIWKALAPHLPQLLPAGHFASICGTIVGSVDPGSGKPHVFAEPQPGGWGAEHDRDGDSAQFSSFHGETFNCPVEVNEGRNGIRVEEFALNPADGGEGEFRGGKGVRIKYRLTGQNAWITAAYSRANDSPWGLAGGMPGSRNRIGVIRADGTEESYDVCTNLRLHSGDVLCIQTATGGGYGDPRRRPREKILSDIRNGYVSRERAVQVYGLEI